MKTLLSCAAALTLLGGCIMVKVREHDAATGHGETLQEAGATGDVCAAPANGAEQVKATPIASQTISDAPGKTLTAVRLDVPPGANSNAHKHAGLVFVYVLEGMVCSQITGDAGVKPYRAGEIFFEPPGSSHLAFTNPTSAPAKVLVTFVANTGATLTTPIQ